MIIIDQYKDFLHSSGKAHAMVSESLAATNTITHLKELHAAARAHNLPVYYGLHQQSHPSFSLGWKHKSELQMTQEKGMVFEEGSWGVKIYEGLEPDLGRGDVVVSKHWSSSSFHNTDLDYELRQRDITHLVMGGATANACLEATARYAYELGYKITLLKDCTAAGCAVQKDAATDLIWPMFSTVMTVGDWVESLR